MPCMHHLVALERCDRIREGKPLATPTGRRHCTSRTPRPLGPARPSPLGEAHVRKPHKSAVEAAPQTTRILAGLPAPPDFAVNVWSLCSGAVPAMRRIWGRLRSETQIYCERPHIASDA